LKLKGIEESFHSTHGALAESNHIFINAGLNYLSNNYQNINILEIGFGTGLNALLTYAQAEAQKINIFYHAIEPYPLNKEIYSQLNYPQMTGVEEKIFQMLHDGYENEEYCLSKNFVFCKSFIEIQTATLKSNFYNLVYFDAFNPNLEPEIWCESVFKKIYDAMTPESILVTYSSKGSVRRTMKNAGFEVEKIPGPKGKREICRVYKS